jgi:hypothetical protein
VLFRSEDVANARHLKGSPGDCGKTENSPKSIG